MSFNITKLVTEYKQNNKEEVAMVLWNSFQPLVYNCMRKYYVSIGDREDIKQEAFVQLFQCLQDYDLSKGVPFEGYYKRYLNFWFLNRIRKKKDLLVIDHDWENGCSMVDTMVSNEESPEEYAQTNETKAVIQRALKELTSKQRKVVTMYYIENRSIGQISKEMGCSYKVACKHKDSAIKKMRKVANL